MVCGGGVHLTLSGPLFLPRNRRSLGLLHAWEGMDCSLFTNALVYSPPCAPQASPRPGQVGRTSASMSLVSGSPVSSSEAALRALQVLLRHP